MPSPAPDDFTLLLNRAADGDGVATEAVWSRSYDELLAIARGIRPARATSSATVPSPTTIIHESFMKTFGPRAASGERPGWDSRAHFFGAAANAMRNILVDQARKKNRLRRNAGGSARQRRSQSPMTFAAPPAMRRPHVQSPHLRHHLAP